MAFTIDGKNLIIDLLLGNSNESVTTGGFGVDESTQLTDSSLQSSVITIDDCESTSGWSPGGAASTMTIDSSNYQEGSASLNMGKDVSSSDAFYEKTITSLDLSSSVTKVYLFVYFKNLLDIDDVSDAVFVVLGTGGFTNAYEYDFARSSMSSGWNGLIIKVDSPTTVLGDGLTTSDVDSVKIGFKSANLITVGDAKLDYIRAVVNGGFGFTDSASSPRVDQKDVSAQFTYKILAGEDNGYDVSSFGLSTSSTLVTKQNFASIRKDETLEIQADEFVTIR